MTSTVKITAHVPADHVLVVELFNARTGEVQSHHQVDSGSEWSGVVHGENAIRTFEIPNVELRRRQVNIANYEVLTDLQTRYPDIAYEVNQVYSNLNGLGLGDTGELPEGVTWLEVSRDGATYRERSDTDERIYDFLTTKLLEDTIRTEFNTLAGNPTLTTEQFENQLTAALFARLPEIQTGRGLKDLGAKVEVVSLSEAGSWTVTYTSDLGGGETLTVNVPFARADEDGEDSERASEA